jgi:hypothetical protein
VANHRRVVADWRDLTTRLAGGRPIFDPSLAAECQAAMRAIGAGLVTAIQPSPQPESYLRDLAATTITPGSWQETIFAFDVGAHNTASWPRTDARLTRVVTLVRPGVPRPASTPNPAAALPSPDHAEPFPALDLELRFAVGTPDESLRQAAIRAVRDALAGLRALDAKGSP